MSCPAGLIELIKLMSVAQAYMSFPGSYKVLRLTGAVQAYIYNLYICNLYSEMVEATWRIAYCTWTVCKND